VVEFKENVLDIIFIMRKSILDIYYALVAKNLQMIISIFIQPQIISYHAKILIGFSNVLKWLYFEFNSVRIFYYFGT